MKRALIIAVILPSCAAPVAPRAVRAPSLVQPIERPTNRAAARASRSARVVVWNTCKASWYGEGTRTASGERFDPDALTAASRTLGFGTQIELRARSRRVTVRINDYGPAAWTGRCLDLSRAAFARLARLTQGWVWVDWRIVGR